MIEKRLWWRTRKFRGDKNPHRFVKVLREGWFLFGFIPLYVRDLQLEA